MKTLVRLALERRALRVRERIIRLATGGGCFLGASLSCADLVVALYSRFLRISRDALDSPDRDYFLLSKGHDVPALYATLGEIGILSPDRLGNHLGSKDDIYWHPNRKIPGVEFHSGSLGHLPSVAAGIALDVKIRGGQNRVVVLTGDGELNEGSVWEALLVARAHSLHRLFLIVDRNGFQANCRTEELVPLEPLAEKFRAFGCGVRQVNGHDFDAIDEALARFPYEASAPSVLIADTVRGKGLPSIEARADRWFCNFTDAEIKALLLELHGARQAEILTAPMVVR
jgi:transketolase